MSTLLIGSAVSTLAQDEPSRLSDLHLPIGKVTDVDLSPDGAYLIYKGYFEYRDDVNIYSLPVGGSVGDEVFLGRLPGSFGHALGFLGFSPDSSRLVFNTPDASLVSIPIDGGEAATTLYQTEPDGSIFGIRPIVDGQVVFTARNTEDDQSNVFTVPLTGGPALQLSQLPGPGWSAGRAEVTEDGALVAYTASISLPVELYTVAIAGGVPTKVSHQLDPGQRISSFRFSPDGSTIAYQVGTAITANFWVQDLYSVPATGGTPQLLHDGWDGGGSEFHGSLGVHFYFFTADSSQVVFIDSDFSDSDIHAAASDGGAKTLLDAQPRISHASFFPEASRLFYQWYVPNYAIGSLELGAGPGGLLSVHPQGNLRPFYDVTPDVSRIAYRAHVMTGARLDLYSVATDGSSPVLLNDPLASAEDVIEFVATDDTVVFDRDSRLVSVPIDGGLETFLTDQFLSTYSFHRKRYPLPNGSDLAYLADFERRDLVELFKVPLTGGPSEKLSPPVTEVQGEVFEYVLSSGGQAVAYRADREERGVGRIYQAPVSGDGTTQVMSPPLADRDSVIAGPELATAIDTVIYEIFRFGGAIEVWATPFGGLPTMLFDLSTVDQYELAPSGAHVIYLEAGELRELDIATGLSRSLEDHSSAVFEFTLSPAQNQILFRAGSKHYSLPIRGGTATQLGATGTLVEFSPDGTWVLVREGDGTYAIASMDGTEARGLGHSGSLVGFSADGQYVLFRPAVTGELWSYSLASETSQRIDGLAGAPEDYFLDEWWPLDGDQIVFALSDDSFWARRLFVISASGGVATPLLDAALEDRQIREVHMSPDRRHLVVDVTDELLGPSALHSVPIDGGPSSPLTGGLNARVVTFTPDSQLVLYQEKRSNFTAPLLAEPVSSGAVSRLTPESFGEIADGVRFGPGDLVTLRIDRHKERTELYALELGDFVLFLDGFESGDTSKWSLSQP